MAERGAAAGEPVEVRGLQVGMTEGADRVGAVIVGDDDDDVGPGGRGGAGGDGRSGGEQRGEGGENETDGAEGKRTHAGATMAERRKRCQAPTGLRAVRLPQSAKTAEPRRNDRGKAPTVSVRPAKRHSLPSAPREAGGATADSVVRNGPL